jgi:N4-(beta-N-acetylglucosaminyl)-L-asparaginase
MSRISRREFVKAGAALAAVPPALGASPTMLIAKATRPVVISSANGNQFKNGGPRTCVEEAFGRIVKGEDVLDSLIAGVNIVELDPLDDSVGYGGLPNADGVVQLDSCCMHGPKRRAGGVAALEGVRTPSLVARDVLNKTDHHLLVGKGAQSFAHNMGFKIEDDLNTEHSRQLWLEWKRRSDPDHYLDPDKRTEAGDRARDQMVAEGLIRRDHVYGTINCDGVNAKGEVCGVTTTSGLSWKIPGRVGDSPILGAGLWVDGEVGAAGSTGRGEYNLYNLSSYQIVENLRHGMAPKDAAVDVLKRIQKNVVEKRLLNSKGLPKAGVTFYVLARDGQHAGVSFYAGTGTERSRYAVCTENGPELVSCESLLGEGPGD